MSQTKQAKAGVAVHIDSEVTRLIRQHARAHMKTEVCGVLIGEQLDNVVEVQAMIEAQHAAQAGTHVTFTQDAWEEIYRVKDQSYPDHRIVGWYHSHPGFGVFLSEHDTFIHKNFFSAPNQVAWVFDPHTDEEGCFGWLNGEIKRVEQLAIMDRNGDGIERTPKERTQAEMEEDGLSAGDVTTHVPTSNSGSSKPFPLWLRVVGSTVSHVTVAVIGFLAALILFPGYLLVAVDSRTMEPMVIDGRPVVLGRLDPLSLLRHATSAPAPAGAASPTSPLVPIAPPATTTPQAPDAGGHK